MDLRAISTGYAERYALPQFMGPTEATSYDDVAIADPFDPRVQALVDRVQCVTAEYDGTTPLTTLCYYVYGTTSAAWLVLLFNGSLHAHALERGPLRLPIPASLDSEIKKMFATTNVGRTVVV